MCRERASGVCRAAGGGGLLAGGSSWMRPETGSFGGLRGASVTLAGGAPALFLVHQNLVESGDCPERLAFNEFFTLQ